MGTEPRADEAPVRLDMVQRLADALGVALSDLLDEQNCFRDRHSARSQGCARKANSRGPRRLRPGLY
jgi:hypothetical protein